MGLRNFVPSVCLIMVCGFATGLSAQSTNLNSFLRGDCNGSGEINVADAAFLLGYLFSNGAPGVCADACDIDDSGGNLDIVDAIQLLSYLFTAGPPPAPPYPQVGVDPTPGDGIDCNGDDPTANPQGVTSITQYGITWTFASPVTAGQFVTGDYWVLGPVEIVQISPPSVDLGGHIVNGSMVNPNTAVQQGYDSTMYAQWENGLYTPSLNAAWGVSPTAPLVLPNGSSLISTISDPDPGALPQLLDAAVLTVLETAPALGSFRPPYAGDNKTVAFHESQVDTSWLDTLPLVAGTPDIQDLADMFERPWIDHIKGWRGRFQHPVNNMPDYGREMSVAIGQAGMLLNMDFTTLEKRELLLRFLQFGIDLYGIVEAGGDDNWIADGGHASGRKFPILFAGRILGDPEMLDVGNLTNVHFGEDGQTFVVEETSPGVYNDGNGGYTAADVGLPEWGIRHNWQPAGAHPDDSCWCSSYRQCCTANAWAGFVLTVHIMDLKALWNHDVLFDYQDRFMQIQTPGQWTRQWDPFTETMWDQYRASYGSVWTP